jgi:arylsulfatase A-like enzyme
MLRTASRFRALHSCTAAGLLVGLCDGVRVVWPLGLSVLGVVATLALAAAVYGILGGFLGAVFELVRGVRSWGQVASKRWAQAVAFTIVGIGVGAASVGALTFTSLRVNRFLAAGVVVNVLLLTWLASLVVAPVFARALSGFWKKNAGDSMASAPPATSNVVGLWCLLPLVVALANIAVLVIVSRTRAPLRGGALWERSAWVFAIGALMPWLANQAAGIGRSVRVNQRVVQGAVIGVAATVVAVVVTVRWEKDFQYLPWVDVVAAVAVISTAIVMYRWVLPRVPVAWLLLATWVLCFPLAVVASSQEVARKVLAAHGGLVGPTLSLSMRFFDADHDGYARTMGGGDCNDSDVEINPAALDWPDDGVDQDCDGHDAQWQSAGALPFHKLPPQVPADANVVFLAIDTLRADHLGTYGYPRDTSPNLDQLGKEGVVFDNGWAHAPSTRYSMPAIFTGRWPSVIAWEDCNACRSWWPRISTATPMLGSILKNAGLYTGSLWAYGYFDADEHRGFERGIDEYDSRRGALHTNVAGPAESVGTSAAQITDDAVAFVQKHKDQRFYLTVHYYDPHMSYEKHPEAPAFGDALADRYDAEVWFTDHHIGRLFAALKAQGLWDKTIVVVTGDHGEGLGERGISAHGYDLYPPQTKVPFIVKVPGLPAHREQVPVSHVDLAPTIVNLVGGEHQGSFLGRSFVDLLSGHLDSSVPVSPVFQEVSYEGDNKKRAIVTATHQLIWNWTPHNTTECYSLADTSGRDLWGTPQGADVCPELKSKLRQWVAVSALPEDAREKMSRDVFGPQASAPKPSHALSGRLGEVIRLSGYDIEAASFVRGSLVSMSYHFGVDGRVPEGWKLFFHLNGPGGSFQNLDHAPVGGAFPVDRWRPGQTIRDQHRFTLDPNLPIGLYTLYIGLWKGSERMPVSPADGDNRLKVIEFQVN